jgi:CyaY protein
LQERRATATGGTTLPGVPARARSNARARAGSRPDGGPGPHGTGTGSGSSPRWSVDAFADGCTVLHGRELPDSPLQHRGRQMRLALHDGQRLQSGQRVHGGSLHSKGPVTEAEYDAVAFPELAALVEALDALDASDVQAELAGDILTIEFEDDSRFVINSHRAARQIWMAADRSAWHFDFQSESARWVAQKSGDELWATLGRVLEKKLGRKLPLTRGGNAS